MAGSFFIDTGGSLTLTWSGKIISLFSFWTFNPRKMAITQKPLRPRRHLVRCQLPIMPNLRSPSFGDKATSWFVMFCTFAMWLHMPSCGIYWDSGQITKIWLFYKTETECQRKFVWWLPGRSGPAARPDAVREFYKRFRTSSKGPYICKIDFLTNRTANVKMFP